MSRFWMLGLLLPLLAACQDDASDETPPDTCGRADYADLIGQNIAAVTLPDDLRHRVIPPNSAVTMELILERLNIMTDEDGTILSLRCG